METVKKFIEMRLWLKEDVGISDAEELAEEVEDMIYEEMTECDLGIDHVTYVVKER